MDEVSPAFSRQNVIVGDLRRGKSETAPFRMSGPDQVRQIRYWRLAQSIVRQVICCACMANTSLQIFVARLPGTTEIGRQIASVQNKSPALFAGRPDKSEEECDRAAMRIQI